MSTAEQDSATDADARSSESDEAVVIPAHTGSPVTRRIGIAALVGIAATLVFGLVITGPEVTQRDAARLIYLHLPSVAVMYSAFAITLVGSVLFLWKGSNFWDLMAGAAAEIGVLFCGLTLITGAIWGKPTWGTYWEWDPRLTSTTVMFVMYLGYLAVRRLELAPEVRSRRAAVLGIVSFVNVIIVHYSVQWWRGLHQGQTISIDTKMDGTMLFTLAVALLSSLAVFAWLLIHRFRVAWLAQEVEQLGLSRALAERRAEAQQPGLAGGGA